MRFNLLMKSYKKILFLFLMLSFVSAYAENQNNDPVSVNQRTPEQEASKQTEKLQNELNLSREQVKALYQINLRYAQARQNTTGRSEVMRIIKKKDDDIRRVLTDEQNQQLETKRITRQQIEVGDNIEYTRTNPETRSPYSNRSDSRRTYDGYNQVPQRTVVSPRNARGGSGSERQSSFRSSSPSRDTNSRSTSTSTSSRSSDSGSSTTRSGGRR